MSKQTAVEWLFAHILPFLPFSDVKEREYFRKCLEEAKAMEREQMINFALHCQEMFKHQIQEKYNETYKGGEQ